MRGLKQTQLTYCTPPTPSRTQVNAQIARLETECESAILAERANVLTKIKANIKLYGFKTSDFRGALATRKKRGKVVKMVTTKKSAK